MCEQIIRTTVLQMVARARIWIAPRTSTRAYIIFDLEVPSWRNVRIEKVDLCRIDNPSSCPCGNISLSPAPHCATLEQRFLHTPIFGTSEYLRSVLAIFERTSDYIIARTKRKGSSDLLHLLSFYWWCVLLFNIELKNRNTRRQHHDWFYLSQRIENTHRERIVIGG